MKRFLKSYLAFTSGLYCILFLLFAPFAIILAGTLFGGAFIGAALFLFVEIGGDFWLFGGVCSRHSGKLAYVMSSARGTEILKKALSVSLARVFLYFFIELISIAFLLPYVLGESHLWHMFLADAGGVQDAGEQMAFFAAFLFEAYALCVIGMIAARFFDSVRATIYICNLAFVLLIFGYALIWKNLYLALGLYAFLAVVSSVLSLWLVERRMKGDYYDYAGVKAWN